MTYFLTKGTKIYSFDVIPGIRAEPKYIIHEYNSDHALKNAAPCSTWEGPNVDRVRIKWNDLIQQGFQRRDY